MSNIKILIVDDEEIIVRLLSVSLRSDGYKTVLAYNGDQGLELFQSQSPDIVVTDIRMPGMDGLELLKKIKQIDPNKEVIITTGHGDIDSTITAFQYGASDLINKPVRDDVLSIALERAKIKIRTRKKLKEYTENLEQKIEEATKEVRRKSNFQKLLIESLTDAIIVFDHNWRTVLYNPEAARIFEEKPSDVKYKMTIDELYTPEMAKFFRTETTKDLSAWKEGILKTKNKKKISVRFASKALHEKGRYLGIVNFFQDISEIKRLKIDRAHYLKDILSGLKNSSDAVDLGIEENDTEKLRTGWENVKKNIKKMEELTRNLSDLGNGTRV